nr:hypothetical protein [Tanacetum cinerariifolium]
MNMSPANKAHFEAEKEAIHLILTGIGDEIYSTVDACQIAHEMWEAIERLQQGESLNIQDVKTNLFWEFGKEIFKPITPPSELASEEDSDPKQAQRDKDMLKNLALIAKYFKKIYKPTYNNLRTSSNSRNKMWIRFHGMQKAKRVKDSAYHKEKMLLCKQAEKGVPLQAEKYDWLADTNKEIDEQELEAHYSYMAKIQEVHIADTCTDSKPLEQVQNDTGYNVFANDLQHFEQSESISNTCIVETNDSNVIPDSPDMFALQNKKTEFEKYKSFNDCTVDYNKLEHKLNENQGQLPQKDIEIKEGLKLKAYEILVVKEKHDELIKQSLLTKSHYEGLVKQKTKAQSEIPCLYAFPYDQSTYANRLIPDREETLALERKSRSKLNKDSVHPYDYTTLNSIYENLKPPTQELEIQLSHTNEIRRKMWRKSFVKYKPNIFKNIGFFPVSKSISKSRQAFNVMTNNINHFKEIVDNAWIKHSCDQFHAPTAQDMKILIQTCLMPLALKTHNDSFIFVHELKQEMHADLKYVESLEKEIDELEYDKAEFSNMYDMILQECVSNDVMCSYLLSLSDLDALAELQCLYLHKVKECDCFAQKLSKQTESVSEEVHTELLQHFAKVGKHSISLEITLQKCKEQTKLVSKTNVSKGLSKTVTAQNLPPITRQVVGNTNVIKPDMYRINTRTTQIRAPQLPHTSRNTNPRVSTTTQLIHKTNVNRPQLRSTQMKDKVVPNKSQVNDKKTKVEDHPMISSIYNKTKFVTACNNSLKYKTSNVNVVCATCGKCLVDSDHFACVTKTLNDVNARTKKHNVVPVSTRKPKSQAKKSIVMPHKKTVASETTTHKSNSYFRMLYENTRKEWK